MNGTPEANDQRKSRRKQLEDLAADFQKAEPALIKEAEQMACKMIRLKLPLIQACAIQSGHMTGKLNIEVLFDLTPKKKRVEVRGFVQPPPVTAIEKKDVEY